MFFREGCWVPADWVRGREWGGFVLCRWRIVFFVCEGLLLPGWLIHFDTAWFFVGGDGEEGGEGRRGWLEVSMLG